MKTGNNLKTSCRSAPPSSSLILALSDPHEVFLCVLHEEEEEDRKNKTIGLHVNLDFCVFT